MFDPPEEPRGWRMPKPSITHLLAIALALSLALSGYLLARPQVRALSAPTPEEDQPFLPAASANPPGSSVPVQPGPAAMPSSVPEDFASQTPLDVNTMVAQLQDMQSRLQATTSLLEQKTLAASWLPSGSAAPALSGGEDIPALLAEIEQLYQIMQPLMVQMEAASRTSRPASEVEAMRSQMTAIHLRLADLLARVEAAKAQISGSAISNPGAGAGLSASASGPEQAMAEQLAQTMAQLQTLLQQLQNPAAVPNGWMAGPPATPFGNPMPPQAGQHAHAGH